MRTLSSAIKTELEIRNNPGVWTRLYEVDVADGNIRYFTDYPHQLSYDSGDGSNNYTPFPIKVSELPETVKNEDVSFTVTIANIDRSIVTELENGNILGRRFTIIHIFVSSGTETIELAYQTNYCVLGASSTQDAAWIVFEVGCQSVFGVNLPRNRYVEARCQWVFKSSDRCDYWDDEFEGVTQGDVKGTGDTDYLQGWHIHNSVNSLAMDINQTNSSHLTIVVDDTLDIPWNILTFPLTGPWFYKVFDSTDSDVDMDIDIEMKIDTSTITENQEGVGIIITGDSDASNDVIAMFKEWSLSAAALRNHASNIVDGAFVNNNAGSGGATDSFIRIAKTGDKFNFYSKALETDSWTQFFSEVTNADLDGVDLRVGVYVKTEDATRAADFDARVDHIRLLAGGHRTCPHFFSDCIVRNNSRRFGAFVGIQKGPISL